MHIATAGVILGDSRSYHPTTNYKETFQPKDHTGARQSPKVPPRVLPPKPERRVDIVSINQADFLPLPLDARSKSFKPNWKGCSSAPFDSTTSYADNYPPQPLLPNPASETLMRTTIPKPVDPSHFVTTNQEMLREWHGVERPPAYMEPPKAPFFQGTFQGVSVCRTDYSFNPEAARPSTSYSKKMKKTHQTNAMFDDSTTTYRTYKQHSVERRDHLNLKTRSKKARETLQKATGRIESSTQYRASHPSFWSIPNRREICPPAPDNLQLFQGDPSGLTSEHRTSYARWEKQPRPSTSCKMMDKIIISKDKFPDETSTTHHFKHFPEERWLQGARDVNETATAVAHAYREGDGVKTAQHFGGAFTAVTTNESEYYPKGVSRGPQVRYRDAYERKFQPSKVKFKSQSEMGASYVPLNGRRAASYIPATHIHFGRSSKAKMIGSTTYGEQFPWRHGPLEQRCPAEVILQQA